MGLKSGMLAAALAVSSVAVSATAATAADSERVDPEIVLATLAYTNGVSASFTIDELSRDYGFHQEGEVGRNAPVLSDTEERSYLEAYLAITPRSVAVPQLIVQSHPAGVPLPAEMTYRKVTAKVVNATGLTAPMSAQASVPCNYQHYSWVQWYDPAGPAYGSKNYYTYNFGSNKEFADSLVVNCSNQNVRHRIYYWSAWYAEYIKHWDESVTPFHWAAREKGSVLRTRMVRYDAGSNYTRAGRFHN